MKHTRKILLAFALVLVIAIAMVPTFAFAAEEKLTAEQPAIDANNKTITVSNVEQFLWLSEYSNGSATVDNIPLTFSRWTIYIATDTLDLSGVTWMPIKDFHGSLIGQPSEGVDYITIENLNVEIAGNAALCGAISFNEGLGFPVFKNIMIKDSSFVTTGSSNTGAYAGAFVGSGYTSSFDNCHVLNTTVSATRWAGGIAGFTYGSVTNCSVKSDENGTTTITARGASLLTTTAGDNAGGIVGQVGEGSATISNCEVSGVTVTAARQAGGIAGLLLNGNTVTACTVSNSTIKSVGIGVILLAATPCAGGIVGQLDTRSGSAIITLTYNIVGPEVSISQAYSYTKAYIGWLVGDGDLRTSADFYYLEGNQNEGVTPSNILEVGNGSSLSI